MCQIRVDCAGTIAQQGCKMMHLSWFTGLQNDGHGCSLLGPYQMLLESGYRQQRRDCHMVLIHTAVRQDQNIHAITICTVSFHEQSVNRFFQTGIFIIDNWQDFYLKARLFHIFDLQKICLCQDRIVDPHHTAVLLFCFQKIASLSNINGGRGHDLLTDRIDGRIGYLRKQLLKIIEQRLMMLRQYSQRYINTHGRSCLTSIRCHAHNGISHIFIIVAECFLQSCSFFRSILLDPLIRDLQVGQTYKVVIQPLTIGLTVCIIFFQFIIINNFSLFGINQQHFTRMKTLFFYDSGRINIQHTYLR